MKTQFDHILQSSFYLWLEYQLGVVGEGYKTQNIDFVGGPEGPDGASNDLLYSTNVPEGMAAYHSPYRQFLAPEDLAPDTELGAPPSPARFRKRISINGKYHFEYPDAINGSDQIIIDYNNGRILLDKATFGTSAQVSGMFNVKTFNSYFTSEDEESVLINSDFLLQNASLQTYLESKNKLGEKAYTVPAAFVTISKSKNKPFAFGGLDETVSTITVVLVTNTNYELDFALSLLRDSTFTNFPIVPYERFPYGEYFSVKPTSRPYKYTEFCQTCLNKAFIESVQSSKLSDKSNKKIQKDLKVGFVDFEISAVRSPRSVTVPVPEAIGDIFANCTQPTPSATMSPTSTAPPVATATSSITYIPPGAETFCMEAEGDWFDTLSNGEEWREHLSGSYEIEQGSQGLSNIIDSFKTTVLGDPSAIHKYDVWSNKGGITEVLGLSFLYIESTNQAKTGWYYILRSGAGTAELSVYTFVNHPTALVPWNVNWNHSPSNQYWANWIMRPGEPCITQTTTLTSSASEISGDEFDLCHVATPTKTPQSSSSWTSTLPPGDEFDPTCETPSSTETAVPTKTSTASTSETVTPVPSPTSSHSSTLTPPTTPTSTISKSFTPVATATVTVSLTGTTSISSSATPGDEFYRCFSTSTFTATPTKTSTASVSITTTTSVSITPTTSITPTLSVSSSEAAAGAPFFWFDESSVTAHANGTKTVDLVLDFSMLTSTEHDGTVASMQTKFENINLVGSGKAEALWGIGLPTHMLDPSLAYGFAIYGGITFPASTGIFAWTDSSGEGYGAQPSTRPDFKKALTVAVGAPVGPGEWSYTDGNNGFQLGYYKHNIEARISLKYTGTLDWSSGNEPRVVQSYGDTFVSPPSSGAQQFYTINQGGH